ncbi:glycosyltransferase [Chromobacterium sphagni]|uniref:glycosyltransferase n=1 Tax=Chromobacterium sphagni TaxID=1903179 RepID=UPI001F4EB074|nr:glycosyltransferase [Chromobacterium sphagni]
MCNKAPYDYYLRLLQVSTAHVYLTYPFVLSWSMLEAMACGCVVIGSRTAPVQEVIEEGRNGLLVDFFSPEDIADAVAGACRSRQDLAELRQAARQSVVERYDLTEVCLPRQLQLLGLAN